MLPKVADAVGSEIEVMFDGGIRSGQDVLRALALGARSYLIGLSYFYGLGAGGEPGVAEAIEVIRRKLDVSMALTGVNRITEIRATCYRSECDARSSVRHFLCCFLPV